MAIKAWVSSPRHNRGEKERMFKQCGETNVVRPDRLVERATKRAVCWLLQESEDATWRGRNGLVEFRGERGKPQAVSFP